MKVVYIARPPGMSRQAAAVIAGRTFRVSPEGDLDMLTRPVSLLTREQAPRPEGPQARPGARSDAAAGRVSEDIEQADACAGDKQC